MVSVALLSAIRLGSTSKCDDNSDMFCETYDSSTSLNDISRKVLPCLCINKVPVSCWIGLMFSFAPRFVADLITVFSGVIGSRSDCGRKNSPPVVNTCKSLPDCIPVIVFSLSVCSDTLIASSSSPSACLKLKNCPTLDANKVVGRL